MHVWGLLRLRNRPADSASPHALVRHPPLDKRLELSPKVRNVESVLADDRRACMTAGFTIPSQTICESANGIGMMSERALLEDFRKIETNP